MYIGCCCLVVGALFKCGVSRGLADLSLCSALTAAGGYHLVPLYTSGLSPLCLVALAWVDGSGVACSAPTAGSFGAWSSFCLHYAAVQQFHWFSSESQ